MKDYTNIEHQFIKEQLEAHAKYLAELFREDISQKKLVETGKLSGMFLTASNFKEYESV